MATAKKVAKKDGATQPAKKAEKKEAPEKKAPKLTPNKLCRDLLLERKYTDDQIAEKVLEVFPDAKFDKAYVSTTRIDLNKGYYKTVEEDLEKNPIARLVEYEGKVMPYDEAKGLKAEAAEAEKKKKAEEAAAKKAQKKEGGVRTGNKIGAGVGEVKNAPKKGKGKKPQPKKS
jgi:hypothetical protein